MSRPLRIRDEREADHRDVRALNSSAFDSPAEADLVDALRERAHPIVSLVAEEEGEIVGHVMFSPVELEGHAKLELMGLGPLAVRPDRQRRGIGSALVHAGLARCREIGAGAVVVLGHPSYYPRFGFATSTRYGITCDYEVPEDAFMVAELIPGYLRDAHGAAHYHPAFDD